VIDKLMMLKCVMRNQHYGYIIDKSVKY